MKSRKNSIHQNDNTISALSSQALTFGRLLFSKAGVITAAHHNKAHAADCKKWHAIFAYAKATPLFATADVRR